MTMTKARLLTFIILLCFYNFPARAQFTLQGRIEYERKTNLHKLWEGNDWMEGFKDKIKPFTTSYFNLAFTEQASRYSPGREGDVPKLNWGLPPGSDNEIVQNFSDNSIVAAKNIYEEHFLIKDSVARLKWRIAGEVRTIAGYKCRKAVARICDSVYVVAFYTDEIPISGGPEQMGGLPGMILELAVPRLYTTWVATKVDVASIKPEELKAPAKGKPISHAALEKRLLDGLKDWGKYAQRQIWWAML
jgi:GLPGLI family protein